MIMKSKIQILSLISLFFIAACSNKNSEEMKEKLISFIERHDSLVAPLNKEIGLAYWESSISGKEEDFMKILELQKQLTIIYSNPNNFAVLKEIKDSKAIKDEILLRQLNVLYNEYLQYQGDSALIMEINEIQNNIEQKFTNFRTTYNGKELTDNDIESILRTSTNSQELEEVWLGHKSIGPIVADDIIGLVKKRNELAQSLGFKNYHNMSLLLSEQKPEDIDKLFDELDELTKETFVKLKDNMDGYFAERYQLETQYLMPWHYQNRYFQEAPKIYEVDFDQFYADVDIVEISRIFFEDIGLLVDDILENSDLYEKPGKNQHAYCIHIDKEGDIRILCNVRPTEMWMNTMLHELGHAVYDKYIDSKLPYSLRSPAHIFTTEAIAMFFGRYATNAQWMEDNLGISNEEAQRIEETGFKQLQLQQIVFSRWSQVMYRFEKAMYENPDQDLNALWWNLVEKYQMIKKPEGRNEPDWATKIHVATVPCYYHNYHLGELLASQFTYYIAENILNEKDVNKMSISDKAEIGSYFREKVFSLGAKLEWNEMIKKATGEKLTAKYYAKQFVE